MKNSIYKIIMLIAICLLAITMGFLLPKTFSKYTKTKTVNINLSIRNPKYTIVFHANPPQGTTPTGTMANQELEYGETQNLNPNGYTVNDYVFFGWNTAGDGTGTTYLDKEAVSNLSTIDNDIINLYAKWQSISTLKTGAELCSEMKKLAGNASANESTQDTKIKSIQKATKDQYEAIKNSLTVKEVQTSGKKTYMWYSNNTIYYYSEADVIYLHPNSKSAFRNMIVLSNISGLAGLDTSKVEDMERMFQQSKAITSLADLANWNIGNVNNMNSMFQDAVGITSLDGLENWDVSNVTNMRFMFGGNSATTPMKIKSLGPLSGWDVSSVENFNQMFKFCKSITTLDPISGWDVSNVTNMAQMFNGAGITDARGIAGWDVGKVPKVSETEAGSGFGKMLQNNPVITSGTNLLTFTTRPGRWNSSGTYVPDY